MLCCDREFIAGLNRSPPGDIFVCVLAPRLIGKWGAQILDEFPNVCTQLAELTAMGVAIHLETQLSNTAGPGPRQIAFGFTTDGATQIALNNIGPVRDLAVGNVMFAQIVWTPVGTYGRETAP